MNKNDLKYSLTSLNELLRKHRRDIVNNFMKGAYKSDDPSLEIEDFVMSVEKFREEFLEKYIWIKKKEFVPWDFYVNLNFIFRDSEDEKSGFLKANIKGKFKENDDAVSYVSNYEPFLQYPWCFELFCFFVLIWYISPAKKAYFEWNLKYEIKNDFPCFLRHQN